MSAKLCEPGGIKHETGMKRYEVPYDHKAPPAARLFIAEPVDFKDSFFPGTGGNGQSLILPRSRFLEEIPKPGLRPTPLNEFLLMGRIINWESHGTASCAENRGLAALPARLGQRATSRVAPGLG